MKKTALGAGALLVVAVLFADPSGMGGEAVKAGETPEPAEPAAPPPKADPAWFRSDPALSTTPQVAVPQRAAEAPQKHWQVMPPAPQGEDFPPRGG